MEDFVKNYATEFLITIQLQFMKLVYRAARSQVG
jgi:hypothetical protein